MNLSLSIRILRSQSKITLQVFKCDNDENDKEKLKQIIDDNTFWKTEDINNFILGLINKDKDLLKNFRKK